MFNTDRDLGNSLYLAYKGMPPKTEKEALLLSLEKWQIINNYYECGGKEILSDGGISTCGCCMLFFSGGKDFCENCPIYNKTRKQYCYDTPYDDYAEIIDNYENSDEEEREFDAEEILKYAKAELKFLQGLFKELYPNE